MNRPFYRNIYPDLKNIKSIEIDSSGLKCFGYEEWHLEYYQIIEKKSYKKLHISVDNNHIIQTSELTDNRIQDQNNVKKLIELIAETVKHVTADSAYDTNPTSKLITRKFPCADVVIPPQKDAKENK